MNCSMSGWSTRKTAHIGAAPAVVRHQAIRYIGVVVFDSQSSAAAPRRLAGFSHMHKPQIVHRLACWANQGRRAQFPIGADGQKRTISPAHNAAASGATGICCLPFDTLTTPFRSCWGRVISSSTGATHQPAWGNSIAGFAFDVRLESITDHEPAPLIAATFPPDFRPTWEPDAYIPLDSRPQPRFPPAMIGSSPDTQSRPERRPHAPAVRNWCSKPG